MADVPRQGLVRMHQQPVSLLVPLSDAADRVLRGGARIHPYLRCMNLFRHELGQPYPDDYIVLVLDGVKCIC